jgi:hypothetical protein
MILVLLEYSYITQPQLDSINILWGCLGIDLIVEVIPHVDKVRMSLNTCKTITVELSTMTFDSLMSFIGADEYAYAA